MFIGSLPTTQIQLSHNTGIGYITQSVSPTMTHTIGLDPTRE